MVGRAILERLAELGPAPEHVACSSMALLFAVSYVHRMYQTAKDKRAIEGLEDHEKSVQLFPHFKVNIYQTALPYSGVQGKSVVIIYQQYILYVTEQMIIMYFYMND